MKPTKHENNFDLIRLFAALQTAFVHGIEWLKLPHVDGWWLWGIMSFPGVPVFFIISGFLVSKSFFDCNGNVLDFGSRRALRIYPGLWAHYLVIFTLLAFGGNLLLSSVFSLTLVKWVLAAFLLGSDYYGYVLGGVPFNFMSGFYKFFPSGVLWSISVELGFYVLVPIVFANALRDRGWTWVSLAFWFAISLAVCMIFAEWHTDLPNHIIGALSITPLAYFWVFLVGATLQLLWKHISPWIEGKVLFWGPLYYGVSYFHSAWGGRHVLDFQNPDALIVLRTFLLGAALLSFAYSFRRISRALMGIDMSYAIYLYHMPVAVTLAGFGILGTAGTWPVFLGITCCAAMLSWFLVEKPMLARKHQMAQAVEALAHRLAHWRDRPSGLAARTAAHHPLMMRTAFVAIYMAAITFTGGLWWVAKSYSKADSPPEGLVISAANKNWDATGGANATVDGDTIVVVGDLSKYGNQFQSAMVPARKPSDYELAYDIELSGGKMGIGILDAKRGRWIKTIPAIESGKGILHFSTNGSSFRVYLFNSNEEPSKTTARVHQLTATPVDKSPEAKDEKNGNT